MQILLEDANQVAYLNGWVAWMMLERLYLSSRESSKVSNSKRRRKDWRSLSKRERKRWGKFESTDEYLKHKKLFLLSCDSICTPFNTMKRTYFYLIFTAENRLRFQEENRKKDPKVADVLDEDALCVDWQEEKE